MQVSLHKVTFSHAGASQPLFHNLTGAFSRGWSGIVGANGTGKTTLLWLVSGLLEPQEGSIIRPEQVIYCAQRTDFPPPLFERFLASSDADAYEIKGRLAVGDDWLSRWNTLSHGERKRAQIGTALWHKPAVLTLDEPTNHIDGEARSLLTQALKSFRGVGLLVSHDRDLLDSLCYQCAVLDPPEVTIRPGGYTKAMRQVKSEEESIKAEYQAAKKAAERLTKEVNRRQEEAAKAKRKRSKRGFSSKEHAAKERIDIALVTGKDAIAGNLVRQLDGRTRQMQNRLASFKIKRRHDLNFWLPDSRSQRDTLFILPAGKMRLGNDRGLSFPELTVTPEDHVALTGSNGTGKSTLIRHIYAALAYPQEKIIYLPQEIDLETSKQIMAEVNALPHEQLGLVMTIVSCLGSRPERLMGNLEASPGEIRKVMLALGVLRAPHLIIMDEPTNHLDLPAIECLEEALEQCPCALLLVSHDYRFLTKLANRRWHIEPDRNRHSTRLLISNIMGIW